MIRLKVYAVFAVIGLLFLGAMFMAHQNFARRALRDAREAGEMGERTKWQEAQRQAALDREEERRRAESRIRLLEEEAVALRATAEQQETELERVVKDFESRGGARTLLGRELVRELNRQGRQPQAQPR